jgi:hypothetical protein
LTDSHAKGKLSAAEEEVLGCVVSCERGFDPSRDTLQAREYWADQFGVSETTLAVTIEHESGYIRAFGWLYRVTDYLRSSSSAGLGSVRTETAQRLLSRYFGITGLANKDVRERLAFDDDFNIAVAAASLKQIEEDHGLTGREAFVAYAYRDASINILKDARFAVANLPDELRYGPETVLVGVHPSIDGTVRYRSETPLATNLQLRNQRWNELFPVFSYLGR